MTDDWKISRRLATLGIASLGATLVIPGRASAAPAIAWTPVALTATQAATLDVVAELIIPATDTPGAREAGVPQFVDRALSGWSTSANALAVRKGLDRIEADAIADYGVSFTAMKMDQQNALLARYDGGDGDLAQVGRGDTETGLTNAAPKASRPFFAILKDMVTAGYFTSQLGATKAVKWDPVPGPYRGCVPLSQIGRAWVL